MLLYFYRAFTYIITKKWNPFLVLNMKQGMVTTVKSHFLVNVMNMRADNAISLPLNSVS